MPLLPGDSPLKGPLNSEKWNRAEAAGEHFHRTQARGLGGVPPPRIVRIDRVTVKNNTGSDRSRGEVVELGTYLLDDLTHEVHWFNGETPNTNRSTYGVLLAATAAGALDDCLLSGVCEARVNVTDASHNYATLESGQHRFKSAAIGPVPILYKPTGTGVKTCAVQLGAPPKPAVWRPYAAYQGLLSGGARVTTASGIETIPFSLTESSYNEDRDWGFTFSSGTFTFERDGTYFCWLTAVAAGLTLTTTTEYFRGRFKFATTETAHLRSQPPEALFGGVHYEANASRTVTSAGYLRVVEGEEITIQAECIGASSSSLGFQVASVSLFIEPTVG